MNQIEESVKDTLQKIASMEAELAAPLAQPDDMAWVIGKAVKFGINQMRGLGLLPPGWKAGDITVDYNRTIPFPKFLVQIQVIS